VEVAGTCGKRRSGLETCHVMLVGFVETLVLSGGECSFEGPHHDLKKGYICQREGQIKHMDRQQKREER